jgi:hypothetical protein
MSYRTMFDLLVVKRSSKQYIYITCLGSRLLFEFQLSFLHFIKLLLH